MIQSWSVQGRYEQLRGEKWCIVLSVGLHGVVSIQPLPPFCHTESTAERPYLDSTGTSEPLIFRRVDPIRTGTEPTLTLVNGELPCVVAQQCPAYKHHLLEDSGVIFLFSSMQPSLTTGLWPEEKSVLSMSMWKTVARRD